MGASVIDIDGPGSRLAIAPLVFERFLRRPTRDML